MASRRDELNAYTFARKRMVGAFLQPGNGGSDEDAPRPIRAVVPSIVVGALVMAGFGLWGMIKPSAPLDWDSGKNVIVGKDSTTRYVVLQNPDGSKMLHPVVNMASAKLVLPADSKVVFVADSVLDHYKSHGATIGIPYAPDKLPGATDAGQAKKWSVCDRPGSDDNHPVQGVFVAADQDANTLERPDRKLAGGDALLVQGPKQPNGAAVEYLVSPQGIAYQLGSDPASVPALQTALFGSQAKAQPVTQQWLDTLGKGPAIDFPTVPGLDPTGRSQVPSSVRLTDPSQDFIGRLVSTPDQADKGLYVVGKDQLFQVPPLAAQLIKMNPLTQGAYGSAAPGFATLTAADVSKYRAEIDWTGPLHLNSLWPRSAPSGQINVGDPTTARPVICSTFEGGYYANDLQFGNDPKRSVWAGTEFPALVTSGSTTAHVSPGHGLLYRAMDNGQQGSGSTFLLTETGLRYPVPVTSQGTPSGSSPSPTPSPGQQQAQPQVNEAQARLGYKDVVPVTVPRAWSDLLTTGPTLSTMTATQEQNS
ncbi:type VII secretion protein EccB [Kitasatospora acidiphila]|uniref:Type VII secretion protein EccB n=1 Tax=Kitasatospora acidiphila TaxID=2567942 RepID=A0A540W8J1_9ACTN|nr:type VII secretion protein EccB [Kitasatospora acidiphila]TQF05349.1 type VII secretion protein EccB [Kitasatospora acidiphila]